MYANWRSQIAQTALMDLALNPDKAVDTADRISAVDALGYAVRFQVKGVRQDPPVFRALVTLLADKDEAVRTMASNILVPIRDPEFRGDAGRPEKKAPEGGWPLWLAKIEANEAGLWKDYDVCANRPLGGSEPMDWYCAGAPDRPVTPQVAFEDTRKAAQADYIPAQAALGMMYANGTGVEQNYVEAGKWWGMAASGGHTLAGALAARAPKVPVPGAIVDGAGVGK
jgi:TPR repeat protein